MFQQYPTKGFQCQFAKYIYRFLILVFLALFDRDSWIVRCERDGEWQAGKGHRSGLEPRPAAASLLHMERLLYQLSYKVLTLALKEMCKYIYMPPTVRVSVVKHQFFSCIIFFSECEWAILIEVKHKLFCVTVCSVWGYYALQYMKLLKQTIQEQIRWLLAALLTILRRKTFFAVGKILPYIVELSVI